jgi:hypothetical protein
VDRPVATGCVAGVRAVVAEGPLKEASVIERPEGLRNLFAYLFKPPARLVESPHPVVVVGPHCRARSLASPEKMLEVVWAQLQPQTLLPHHAQHPQLCQHGQEVVSATGH